MTGWRERRARNTPCERGKDAACILWPACECRPTTAHCYRCFALVDQSAAYDSAAPASIPWDEARLCADCETDWQRLNAQPMD